MAKIFSALLLLLLLLVVVKAESHPAADGSGNIDCLAECTRRCSKASRHKICMRCCMACCHKCNCVPSGTYGHEDECPCYANMKDSHGKPKCP
ncbi:cypmaclein-like [Zingiber officinale]|uniref:Uncharacterized protein n=1 Tax=Zingiber officinale TaxID=94328 RepID=A0A8J5HAP0_ZINOF|nr:cypmaclein-like [Zingiber officinale]KAG6519734.1 hypothetical protein ZIOFF_023242 [Zingiber officinale]